MTVFDALAIAQAVRRGDAVLTGPVIFHREVVNVTVPWQPAHGVPAAVLEWHRERLETRLRKRVQELETQSIDGMTEAEVDALWEKYKRYRTLLEVCNE